MEKERAQNRGRLRERGTLRERERGMAREGDRERMEWHGTQRRVYCQVDGLEICNLHCCSPV